MSLNVSKDSKGFDDIDKFWSAVDTEVVDSETSSEDEFAYDTSSTISESSDENDEDEDESQVTITPVSTSAARGGGGDHSLESNLSESLTLHENEEEEEDTDAQEGTDDSSEEETEKEEVGNRQSPGKGKKSQDRRQSKVQFEESEGGAGSSPASSAKKGSRRLSAPAALSSSRSDVAAKQSKTGQQGEGKEQEIDESSPFHVEGRLSEIPQLHDEDSGVSPSGFDESNDFYDNNAAPFEDESMDESSATPDLRTPSTSGSKGKKDTTSSKKGKKGSKYTYYDTPGTTPGSEVSTPGGYIRGRALPDESYRSREGEEGVSDDSDGEGLTDNGVDTTTDRSFVDTSYLQALREGKMEDGSFSDQPEHEEEGGPRRSRRATKGQRVQFWKNERPQYEKGRMVGILQAEPTPAKPKRVVKKKKKSTGKQSKRLFDGSSGDESSDGDSSRRKKARKAFPSSQLPLDVTFISRKRVDTFSVWDDVVTAPASATVIHLNDTAHPPTKLPITAVRPPGKDVVGVAAQSFNVPEIPQKMSGWISGFCELPPGGIKDAEGVGECCQVFQVASCQDGSVEFGLAHPSEEEWVDTLAQRTVLKARDSFYVPPGNIYRLENHSKVEPCVIYWTIIRPLEEAEDVAAGGGGS
mmetsp:Transcript_25517/g.43035  ORF Transcript_25517/g.43035 Transcript_25517/m.43035 type:complete len:639 (-) Transcript_25517:6149-8065(-)